ncbi:TonB-dependent receptor, partial [Klebsiella aerogenes]|uniref:TonB-dependent receptor n=4 Tax=Pseudomonadota TaxID=1224 RepID=UPI0013D41F54
ELQRAQPTSLGDALFDRPGLSASTFAPGSASRPIIRGLDNSRVRIQENGTGVQDVSDLGEDHAVPINPLVNDRIEVIRGPA